MSDLLYNNGGFDLSFTVGSLPTDSSILVKCSTDIVSGTTGSIIKLSNESDLYYIYLMDSDSNVMEKFKSPLAFRPSRIRYSFHNQFLTVYFDDFWIHTFCVDYIFQKEDAEIQFSASEAISVMDVVLVELDDWRDAIYIDLEQNSASAIGNIIQSRPVVTWTKYDGSIRFAFAKNNRSVVSVSFVREHSRGRAVDGKACSDAIAQFSEVATIIDPLFGEKYGFVTRFYKVPELDTGAIRACKYIQSVGRQNYEKHSLTCRINPVIEVEDLASYSYTTTGTPITLSGQFIVESLNVDIQVGRMSMQITGRGKDD